MKILHVASERRRAEAAARALHAVAQNVTVTWAPTFAAALQWLDTNRDTAAAIVDTDVQAQGCAGFVEGVHGLRISIAVVAVVATQPDALAAALNAGADAYVMDGPSIDQDLRQTVSAVIRRERGRRDMFARTLAEVDASREEAADRAARAEAARQEAEERAASGTAAIAARIQDIETRHRAALSREARLCTALQQRLLELEAALRQADERRASDAIALADQLATRHADFTASLAQAAQSRDALAAKLSVATAALDEALRARKADAAAAAAHLTRRESELTATLTEAVAARNALETALAEAEAALHDARHRAAVDVAAAAERQAALEDLLAQETDARTALEQQLAATEAARREADTRHAAESTAAQLRLTEVQARHDAADAAHAATRDALQGRLSEVAAALDGERQARASEAAAAAGRLARREAELGAELVEAHASRSVLEHRLFEAEAAHETAVHRLSADLSATAGRETELIDRLASESSARAALESALDALRQKSHRARVRSLGVISAYRRRTREHAAALEASAAGERAAFDQTLRAKDEEIRHLQADRDGLQSTLVEERQINEQARLASEAELQRISAEYGQLRQSLDHLQAALHTLERIADEHAVERARLESVVADRDSALNVQAAENLAERQAAHDALARIQDELRETRDASRTETTRLQRELDSLRRELDAARAQARALGDRAALVPTLQAQLDANQRERRRQFERAPYGLCHCTRDGAIVHANHWLARLLGYRRADDLRKIDFAAAVFECADDWRWLIDRALSTRKAETIEAVWTAANGRRLAVRLQALAIADDSIEIVVEDVTSVRALEDRLRHAQRMEAVGRLASEVAVTCDTTLRGVTREAGEWLTTMEGESALRRQGEQMLSEMRRAASCLRQLGAYGEQQMNALEPVSVQRVLRDLAPVLERVAGDGIGLVFPKASGSFDVDVDAERVERVLVNVASYARERMSAGGQMKIDLSRTIVGRRFIATYPGVRPGPHVLITVAEVARAAAGEAVDVRTDAARDPEKPGVDLGALVELVASCGGHLWIEAERAGDMMLKIHLPARVSDRHGEKRQSATRAERGRGLARWLRDRSAALVRS